MDRQIAVPSQCTERKQVQNRLFILSATHHMWRLVLPHSHRVGFLGEHWWVVIHIFHSDAQH